MVFNVNRQLGLKTQAPDIVKLNTTSSQWNVKFTLCHPRLTNRVSSCLLENVIKLSGYISHALNFSLFLSDIVLYICICIMQTV